MIEEIEKELKVHFPEVYRRLYQGGMLDWGVCSQEWARTELRRMRAHPPLLLFAEDFRIIPVREIADRARKQKYKPEGTSVFVPFGRNLAGELYGFAFNDAGVMQAIYKINTRTEAFTFQARTFEEFVFKKLLQTAAEYPLDENENLEDFLTDAKAMLQSHAPYLPTNLAALLRQAYAGTAKIDDGYVSLVSDEDYLTILKAAEKNLDSLELS